MILKLLLLLQISRHGEKMFQFESVRSPLSHCISAQSDFITCFTNVEGTEETRCRFSEGFTTCFTSYGIGE